VAKDQAERRTNPQRTAKMRMRILEATIECLLEFGYAGTSTRLVTERAEVSRGALLHHFPTRADLMLETAEYIVERQDAFVREHTFKLAKGVPRLVAITDRLYQTVSSDEGIALTQIMVGTALDRELRERFAELWEKVERRQFEDVWALARYAGIEDRATIAAMCQLNQAATRGISIHNLFKTRANRNPALDLLMDHKRRLVRRLQEEAGVSGDAPGTSAVRSERAKAGS
jgi:AcrR family transcriptional regulator